MDSRPIDHRQLALLAGLLLLTGCGSSNRVHGDPPPPPVQGPDYFYELEPNDTPEFPDFIQYVSPLTDTIIEGHLEGGPFGFYDTYDHFEFVTGSPAEFSFELYTEVPFADLAIGVYDPYLGEIVLWWDSPYDVEFGSFVVHEPGKVFQIVVHAPALGTEYSLDLFGYPYPYGLESEGGPGAASGLQTGSELGLSAGTQGRAPDRDLTSGAVL